MSDKCFFGLCGMVKILLVDDYAIVRLGVRTLLAGSPEWEVTAEAADGRQALEEAARHKPDVVILKAVLPELSGPACAARLLALLPKAKVIAICMNDQPQVVEELFKAGARACLHIKDCAEHLKRAMEAALQDLPYISPELGGRVVLGLLDESKRGKADKAELTAHEREILQMIAEEHTSQEIAARLHLSAKTIEFHRKKIARKLKVDGLAGMVKQAIRLGLTPLE